jgi:hypothetical protein
MTDPQPSAVPVPAQERIACLDALAGELHRCGPTAFITSPLWRPPRLFAQAPGDPQSLDILAALDDATGEWRYLRPWAERIGAVSDRGTVVDVIVQGWANPAGDAR